MKHDVVVVGGGHAGCEAALAAARTGAAVALVTLDPDAIGRLSCNPAIGGIGKGHLVREVDALGGAMGDVADAAGIQFRLLNRSRGPAVRGPRAQVDRAVYRAQMQAVIETSPVRVVAGEVADLLMTSGRVCGVILGSGAELQAGAVVLTTGTFLGGMIHLGDRRWPAGRIGEAAASQLSARLRESGLPLGRLKTGTPPRLDAASLDLGALDRQPGDDAPAFFSDRTERAALPQVPCHITRTTGETHALVRANLDRSAMYGGHITGVGPRYCPSIEDKVVRFADRESHQVFLEPEGLSTDLIYPNGISNSLPEDVQEAMVRSMPGCENASIAQSGYAIEYDTIDPRSLDPTLELRGFPGLFLAGQISGTTGYEEAAGQGLLAGLNAALRASGTTGATLSRSEAYIGVMVDDLVTNGVDEPYRMFTSRAEHRLILRADNACDRLSAWGERHGLLPGELIAMAAAKRALVRDTTAALSAISLSPQEAGRVGVTFKADGKRRSGLDLLAHDNGGWKVVLGLLPQLQSLPEPVRSTVYADALYRTHAARQAREAEREAVSDQLPIPPELMGSRIPGLSNELCQKLQARQPATLGEAKRIAGMTPAGLALIAAHARRAAGTRSAA